jgi:nitroreductase
MTSHTSTLSVADAAQARRSIRQYEPTPVPHADLREILRITGLAPSPWNLQPWRFVVVEDPTVKSALQRAAYGQAQVGNAPAVIVMYSDMTNVLETVEETIHPGMAAAAEKTAAGIRANFGAMSDADRAAWGFAESNIALGYLLLTAQSFGYSTSPMLGFDAAQVKTLLGLPADARIPAIVAIGRGAEEGFPHHRHAVDRITRFV